MTMLASCHRTIVNGHERESVRALESSDILRLHRYRPESSVTTCSISVPSHNTYRRRALDDQGYRSSADQVRTFPD
jgi:hypothetical protein